MTIARIQLRRGTASQWTTINPVLANGEAGYETDTRKIKVGNGTSTWSQLQYMVASTIPGSLATLSDVDATAKQNGSVLYYDSAAGKFLADDITTKISLVDGGNF